MNRKSQVRLLASSCKNRKKNDQKHVMGEIGPDEVTCEMEEENGRNNCNFAGKPKQKCAAECRKGKGRAKNSKHVEKRRQTQIRLAAKLKMCKVTKNQKTNTNNADDGGEQQMNIKHRTNKTEEQQAEYANQTGKLGLKNGGQTRPTILRSILFDFVSIGRNGERKLFGHEIGSKKVRINCQGADEMEEESERKPGGYVVWRPR